MKRIGNLYTKICSLENLQLADIRASKAKKKQHGVIRHITWTIAKGLQDTIQKIPKTNLPFETTIVSKNDKYFFT